MVARHPGMVELEEALIADRSKTTRNFLLQRLTDEGQRVKARLDRGLPPKEADDARLYLEALLASHQTIRAVWHYHHGSD